MIDFLRQYIACDTSYPVYNYQAALDLLSNYSSKHGLAAEHISLSSGYRAIIITLTGSDSTLPALMLNHHMDVVPAMRNDGWVNDPFKLHEKEGMLIGRGTQDMKGVGIAHLVALSTFKEKYGVPKRTIYCIAVPHEEHGGFEGTACLINDPIFARLGIGYVLDEGMPSGDSKKILIKIAEKSPLQVCITALGTPGHGSIFNSNNAIHTLVAFLSESKDIFMHYNKQKTIPYSDPGLCLSYNITSFNAGTVSAHNCVPAKATASIDIRVPPGEFFDVIVNILDELCKRYSTIEYDIKAKGIPLLPIASRTSDFYQTLVAALKICNYQAEPHYFEGASDGRFYVQRGINVLGITPFSVSPNLHGVNEAILYTDLMRAKDIFVTFLLLFCKDI